MVQSQHDAVLRYQQRLQDAEERRRLDREADDQTKEALLAQIRKAATEREFERQRANASEQRYHELVLKAMAPPPPPPRARVEDAPPEAEDRARQQASVESKLRLAEEIIDKAAKQGKTIDYASAYKEAETMYDHPELISLEP
jgi:hypothetical protein